MLSTINKPYRNKNCIFRLGGSAVIVWALLAGFAGIVSAQNAPDIGAEQFNKGLNLYEHGLFEHSSQELGAYSQANALHPFSIAADYYKALNSGKLDSVNTEQFYKKFVRQNPRYRFADTLLLELGSRNFINGNYGNAVALYEQAIDHEVDSSLATRIYYWMAEASAEQGKNEEARTYFLELANTFPNSHWTPSALYARGRLYLSEQQYEEASNAFEMLRKRHPNDPMTRRINTALGESYYQQGKYKEAIEAFEDYLPYMEGELKSKAVYLIAESHNYLNNFDKASTYYLQFIKREKGEKEVRNARYGLGWVYHKQEIYHWAAESFGKAAGGEDELGRKALYYKAVNEKLSGRYRLALKTFARFGEQFKEGLFVEEAYYEWAVTAYELGQYSRTIEILLPLVRSDQTMDRAANVYTLLGEAYFANKEYTRSLQAFDAAEQLTDVADSVKHRAQFQKAWVQYNNQAYRQAQPLFEQVYSRAEGDLAAEALFWSADAYYGYEHYGPASSQFRQFLEITGDHKLTGAARYSLGWSYFKMGEYQKAIRPFKDFLIDYDPPPMSMFPYDTDTRLRIGDAYFAISEYDSARTYYEMEIGAEPGGDYAMFQVANCYYRSQNTYQAVQTFRRMLRIYPYSRLSEQAQYNVAYIYFLMNNYDQAISEFKTVISRYPNTDWAARSQYNIADAFYNAGEYEKAIEAYNKVLDQYPRSDFIIDAVNGIRYAQTASGKVDSSSAILENFLKQHPQASTADRLRFRQANMRLQSGNYKEAVNEFRNYLRITNNRDLMPDAYYNLAEAYEQLDRHNQAIQAYESIVEEFPESDRTDGALEQLGRIHYERDEFKESIQYFKRILDRGRSLQVEAHLGVADSRLALNELDSARVHFQEARDLESTNSAAQLGLGRIALKQQRYDEATEIFQQISDNNTTQVGARAQYLLGLTYQRQGQCNKALEAYSRVKILYEAYVDWVSRALVNSAECYLELGNKSEAQNTLNEVLDTYGRTEAAKDAQNMLDSRFDN